ncbi:hypothetical protein F3Y22_tig00110540pilonHSYRG00054 [Hibiscus syriacus]|uniref:Uncharacterized protein n=1 Tax=Hibiscus syriacus TaxID=106335 RepID=A0A6A3AFF8_HIBSY|nr:hypothetical protein F3Y22_tig00110540pilonHSYRG00054 [Hibiscus syriacus]
MASSCDNAIAAILILGLVGQVPKGVEIKGQPEWKVTITNNCKCTQHELRITCHGFQSVETVDPSIFEQRGDKCLVNQGNALTGFGSVGFSYAWDPPFIMFPSSSVDDFNMIQSLLARTSICRNCGSEHFVKQGDDCLVIQGNALNGFGSVNFLYAWDPPFFMFPLSSVVDDC